MEPVIVIVDYGAGNLRSVSNAIQSLGYIPEISSVPQRVKTAQIVILPGVGAAGPAMRELEKQGLAEALCYRVKHGHPLLGVCLGLQLLMDCTEEGGKHFCLGAVHGTVRKFPAGVKIPHIGWNQVSHDDSHPVFKGITSNTHYYFVHSYYVVPENDAIVIGRTDYNGVFCSAIACGLVVATQFHPEKSGVQGLKFFDNYIKFARELS